MGGCYSAIKGTKKENGPVPAVKEDSVSKVAELLPSKEETTLEVTKISKEETLPKEDLTCEVSSPKEETASEVVASSKEVTTSEEVALLLNEETAASEVVTLPKKEDVMEVALPPKEEVISNEVVVAEEFTNVKVEAPMKNDESCDVKETKKEKDGEKVVMDESKLTIEKMTLEAEETSPKEEEAKAVASKESVGECEAVEEQKTDKQAPVA